MIERLRQLYPRRTIKIPQNINDIPMKCYMIYILVFNGRPIVLGHGKKNRAKVIFDNKNRITKAHLKALLVRLYNLFGKGRFERYIIPCRSKDNARILERELHRQIGGNNRILPPAIRSQLFQGLLPGSVPYLILEIALRSSFDGLSDIKKWRADGILKDTIWTEIAQRLQLN